MPDQRETKTELPRENKQRLIDGPSMPKKKLQRPYKTSSIPDCPPRARQQNPPPSNILCRRIFFCFWWLQFMPHMHKSDPPATTATSRAKLWMRNSCFGPRVAREASLETPMRQIFWKGRSRLCQLLCPFFWFSPALAFLEEERNPEVPRDAFCSYISWIPIANMPEHGTTPETCPHRVREHRESLLSTRDLCQCVHIARRHRNHTSRAADLSTYKPHTQMPEFG